MRKRWISIIIVCSSLLFCSHISWGGNCRQEIINLDEIQLRGFVEYGLLCDSSYNGSFINYFDNIIDTVINGNKYAYVLAFSEKSSLAFREYSEKHGMLMHVELLIEGVPVKLHDAESGYEDYSYYDTMRLSPNNKYVSICEYYPTQNPSLLTGEEDDEELEEKEILKFREGRIIDSERGFIFSLAASEVDGYWNYCNQWVVNSEVIFDPNRNTEQYLKVK